jgi:phytoene dehydrogenase-like protein
MRSKHAIVIGGSIAGLCAGRVLSDFFEHVTVIDRDI